MCVNPILIQNKKYVPNKANGGKPPKCNDNRLRAIEVPCGRCHQCRLRKGTNWTNRITEELRQSNGIFVTFSLSNESFNEIQSIIGTSNSEAVAKYAIKQWREKCRKSGKSPRYWMVTELGQKSTERLHLHGIIFNSKGVEKLWKYGNIFVGDRCNEITAKYIVKYMSKPDKKHPGYYAIVLCSKGIGLSLAKTQAGNIKKFDRIVRTDGKKIAPPKYIRDKVLSDEEREKKAIERLDKGIVYFNGQEFNVTNRKQWIELQILKENAYREAKSLGLIQKKKQYGTINATKRT